LARWRTSCRRSRTCGGAIHALRQPTHAQQVRQIGRVTEVVGHPPVGERLHAQWWARCTPAPIVVSTSAAPTSRTSPPARPRAARQRDP
jgi:hypothetical protein